MNYDDVPSITDVLNKNKVEILISTIGTTVGSIGPELALIAAADKASTTKRYIPSIWGVPYTKE